MALVVSGWFRGSPSEFGGVALGGCDGLPAPTPPGGGTGDAGDVAVGGTDADVGDGDVGDADDDVDVDEVVDVSDGLSSPPPPQAVVSTPSAIAADSAATIEVRRVDRVEFMTVPPDRWTSADK